MRLGQRAAEAFGRRGYRGLCNVDFVVTADERMMLAEVNLRQSAPLDQWLVQQRRHGRGWNERGAYRCDEDVPADVETITQVAAGLRARGGNADVMTLLSYGPRATSVLISGASAAAVATVAEQLRSEVAA